MIRLRDLPLQRKVIAIIMLTSGAALLLASAAFITYSYLTARNSLVASVTAMAHLIGDNVTAAVTFDDVEAATDTLDALRSEPSVNAACVYKPSGLFAQHLRAGAAACPAAPGPVGSRFDASELHVVDDVLLQNERIGTVYLRAPLAPMRSRIAQSVGILVGIFMVSVLLALALSARLARIISQPFNEILQQVEQGKEELEQRVIDRTIELQKRNEELDRSNKELDDFAYVASHDLKEPLRGIHNYSSFLIEDYADRLDEDGRQRLHTLIRLSQRMESLIDSLLDYSRAGRVELAIRDCNLNEIVADVVDALDIRLRENQVAIRIPRPLPTVRCDGVRVGEVFMNLITNAMKYNDNLSKWIEIGYQDGPDGPILYVRDNGIGIPERHQQVVFRIFKRLHARDKYGGGSGAGLTIVKKIIERHDGRIWLESDPGRGTTFYFTLQGQLDQDAYATTVDSSRRGQS